MMNITTPYKNTKSTAFFSPLKSSRKRNVQFDGGLKSAVKVSLRDTDQDDSAEKKGLDEEEEDILVSRQARRRR